MPTEYTPESFDFGTAEGRTASPSGVVTLTSPSMTQQVPAVSYSQSKTLVSFEQIG